MGKKYSVVINVLVLILLAFFVAFVSASRGDFLKESNDTLVYFKYFECVKNLGVVQFCDSYIGSSPVEFIYQWMSYFSSIFFDFYGFKFVFAFFVSIAILYSVCFLSPGFYFPLFILIADFRFWEYISNILRQGLSVAIFMIGLALSIKYRSFIISKLKYFSVGAHVASAIFILTPKKQITKNFFIGAICIAVLSVVFSNYWMPFVLGLTGNEKLAYYIFLNADYEFSMPMHYLIVFILGSFLGNKIDDGRYVFCYNICCILFVFSIVFGLIGLSYRMTSFVLPFIVICFSHQIEYISSSFPKYKIYIFPASILIVSLMFAAAFYRNMDAFFIHLS